MTEWDLLPEKCRACLESHGIGPGTRIAKRRRRRMLDWRRELADLPKKGRGKMRFLRSLAERYGYSIDHLRRVERKLRQDNS